MITTIIQAQIGIIDSSSSNTTNKNSAPNKCPNNDSYCLAPRSTWSTKACQATETGLSYDQSMNSIRFFVEVYKTSNTSDKAILLLAIRDKVADLLDFVVTKETNTTIANRHRITVGTFMAELKNLTAGTDIPVEKWDRLIKACFFQLQLTHIRGGWILRENAEQTTRLNGEIFLEHVSRIDPETRAGWKSPLRERFVAHVSLKMMQFATTTRGQIFREKLTYPGWNEASVEQVLREVKAAHTRGSVRPAVLPPAESGFKEGRDGIWRRPGR